MKAQKNIYAHQPIKLAFLATILVLNPRLAQADSVDIKNNNSALIFTTDDPIFNLGTPGDPVQFPRTLEWTVEGRKILVYPSAPSNFLDIDHKHPGLHVGPNQIHAQGPLFGYSASAVTGGVVYTITGGAPGSGVGRLSEKVDIRNKSNDAVSLSSIGVAGLGWKPDPSGAHNANLKVPDLSGLDINGTTVAFIQGDVMGGVGRPLITDPPFAPVTVFPTVCFSGFNPFLVKGVILPPGATLTMITELTVATTSQNTPGEINQNPWERMHKDKKGGAQRTQGRCRHHAL